MRSGEFSLASLVAAVLASLALATPATADAAACGVPGEDRWDRVTPAAAGMDGEKLREAIRFGLENSSATVRVYRNGCFVAGEPGGYRNTTTYESWSLAKSVTALIFGRAWTMGLISPADPLGSLIPEADRAHGRITMRELLTMSGGLRWNFFRDYNIAMPNRLREALTVGISHEPGAYWEYSQSGPALVAEAISRAVGEDFQSFARRELFSKLGISTSEWRWSRDGTGHTQGFFGLNMSTNNFARLGELMRRGGVWDGERLLSTRFVREALTPTPTNGCYGYMIWLNASKPCVGPRVVDRPVTDARFFPSLPADAYQYSGLFGQWVTVFPGYGVIVARNGFDTGAISGGTRWQERMYRMVLDAVVDPPTRLPRRRPDVEAVSHTDSDTGIFEALQDPETFSGGMFPPPLPAAGPARARAILIAPAGRTVPRSGVVAVRLSCPPRWGQPGLRPTCAGKARMRGARRAKRYAVPAGHSERLRFRLDRRGVQRLLRRGRAGTLVRAVNRDRLHGAPATRRLKLRARR